GGGRDRPVPPGPRSRPGPRRRGTPPRPRGPPRVGPDRPRQRRERPRFPRRRLLPDRRRSPPRHLTGRCAATTSHAWEPSGDGLSAVCPWREEVSWRRSHSPGGITTIIAYRTATSP